MITKLEDLVGRTIEKVVKHTSRDGVIKILQVLFHDGEYCVLVCDNPSIGVNLMDDEEHIIPPGSLVLEPAFEEDGSLREISLRLNSNQRRMNLLEESLLRELLTGWALPDLRSLSTYNSSVPLLVSMLRRLRDG